MRALSISRPWASLIVAGRKPVENRTWSTSYRGLILVHAAQSWDGDSAYAHVESCQPEVADRFCWDPGDHPVGVVGTAVLAKVCAEAVDGGQCDCGPYAAAGQYHWRLSQPRRLPEAVPWKGRLGLWAPPPELRMLVRVQLEAGRS